MPKITSYTTVERCRRLPAYLTALQLGVLVRKNLQVVSYLSKIN